MRPERLCDIYHRSRLPAFPQTSTFGGCETHLHRGHLIDMASIDGDTLRRTAATIREAEDRVKEAISREAIARNASASAAQAQVNAEAEVFRLRAEIVTLRSLAKEAELAQEQSAADLASSEAALRELVVSRNALIKSNDEARQEIQDLGAVLLARTQDIKQLGQVIVSVFRGEILPSSLGDMAAGIANIIGPNLDSFGAEERNEQVRIEAVSNASDKSSKDDLKESGGVLSTSELVEDEEDSSVPVDSAFFGVEASEVTWEEPLSVRKTRPRPQGVPGLALDRLAPPPDDPDAAMLEFAYEQQYGKAEARRMMEEAKTVTRSK